MNVTQGVKAVIVLPAGEAMIGEENNGIKVHVDRLAAPGEQSGARIGHNGPEWHCTALDRPFQQYEMMSLPDGFKAFRKAGMLWGTVVPDSILRRLVEPPEKVVEREEELVLR